MKTAGWVLLGGGALVLVGYGVYYFSRAFFTDASIPLAIRVAMPAVALGLLLLLAGVLCDRLARMKEESFKEVDR